MYTGGINLAISPAMQENWDKAIQMLASELPSPSFTTWIKPLKLRAINKDTMLIEVPDPLVLSQLNGRYKSMLEAAVKITFGRDYFVSPALTADIEKQLAQVKRNNRARR